MVLSHVNSRGSTADLRARYGLKAAMGKEFTQQAAEMKVQEEEKKKARERKLVLAVDIVSFLLVCGGAAVILFFMPEVAFKPPCRNPYMLSSSLLETTTSPRTLSSPTVEGGTLCLPQPPLRLS